MTQAEMINQLANNLDTFLRLFAGIDEERYRWKPAADKWSMLEVLNHLHDEERDDFRTRLRLVLQNPKQDWPPIDPQGWAVERKYNARDPGQSLVSFERERLASIAWLRNLDSPDWDNAASHPIAGSLSAGDLLAAWLAHDFLHMRQLANISAAYVTAHSVPYSTRYAAP
jgi:hypothetical protein